ncbi:MAG: hypothetical protein AAB380_08440, partial [Verrucomicrobiota bacterium]
MKTLSGVILKLLKHCVRIGETTFGHTTVERVPEAFQEFLALQAEAKATPSTEEIRKRTGNGEVAEIHVGLGSCCMAKGSDKLFHALNASAAACGGSVVVKRVGCVGMCHRTPMIEVAEPGKPGTFYSDLTAAQARALVQRHFKPRGFLQRASRVWARALDGLLLDDTREQQSVQRFSMSKRDPNVRAFLDKQVHIATEHFGKIDPLDLDEYLAHGGFAALARCLGLRGDIAFPLTPALSPRERENRSLVLEKSEAGDSSDDSRANQNGRKLFPLPHEEGQGEGKRRDKSEINQRLLTSSSTSEEIISIIEKSGLRGRGGAGFPTAQKWRVVREQPGDVKYVICNGDEGDPGAFMDRMILESFPFRIIEGLAIAAVAVGAREG